MNDDLRGLGGWLTFFIIIMIAISPIFGVLSVITSLYGDRTLAAAYGELWGTLQLFEWLHALVLILGCWFIAWRLINVHNRTTVAITLAGIWLIAVGGLLTEFLGVAMITGIPFGDLLAAGIGPQMVRPIVFCALWTSYFMVSRRVRNTYLSGDEQAEVFE